MDAGRQTLDAFSAEWWRLYAIPNLAPVTRRSYAALRDSHILPALGRISLRAITVTHVQQLQADMLANGVGPETVTRTLSLLQDVLERAAEWGIYPRNPVRYVEKPPVRP
jgi:hypothetical protein